MAEPGGIMQNSLPDKEQYPQFSQGKENAAAAADVTVKQSSYTDVLGREKSLFDFRINPAVQNRPGTIAAMEKNDCGLVMELNVKAKKAVHSYTHETALYLYKEAESTVEKLYLHIQLWTDEIFRVIFSGRKEIADPFVGIPQDKRMLVGKPQKVTYAIEETDTAVCLTTKKIWIRIDKGTNRITAGYPEGEVFFSQRKEEFQTDDIHDLALSDLQGEYACFEAIDLEGDEVIYGLGERFDSLTRNGRTVDFHNKDAVGTTSPRTYVNVPFYISTRGYGLFLNAGAGIDWQIGTLDASALQFGVLDSQLDYFVIAGKTPARIIENYCYLTGFSKLPPLWSFGLWMSRNSYVSWDVAEDVGKKIRENDIPCDVLHLDTAWFNRDWNCDLKFSEERFPDPGAHMKKLKEDGFHISLWQYNFIPPNEDNANYQEAVKKGYLSKKKDGTPYQLPQNCQGSWVDDVTIDFSNPQAREWYAGKIAALMELGAGAIKTDFGEGIAEDAVYQNIDGKQFHNLYSLVYNSTVFEACKKVTGENLVWARSGTAGSQRYPVHWGGDSQCTFEALAGTLRAALSVGISGIPFFSHDIGGFIGTPSDELYVRWAQLGLFSSHSRCHGAGDNNYREPWRFSKEVCDIFRYYDKLRYSLMPYIYEEAKKCTKTGLPMMRALYLAYPEDRNVWHIDDQYLFGDSLLIAPVLKPLCRTEIRNIYLPAGTWFDYFTKEKIVSGGMWIKRKVDLKTMPIYVKEGAELKYCEVKESLMNGMGQIVKIENWV
ncbi:MAG: DUF4968 domain-containing protein [Lachnospiraceae bacterium]|nr:DUF4968 domain-containing protein [Lachnospiraceae bacterium]